MKKILSYLAIVVFIIVVFILINQGKKNEVVENTPTPETPTAIDMCYHYYKATTGNLADKAWLTMSITGDKVTGEYQNIPAEKDKKIGKFSGTVGKMDPKISARIADVMWNSSAEGMDVTEQLKIEFGEGSAVALFGEMVDRGDGVYVYKDPNKLTPGFQMSQADCATVKN